MDTPKLSERLRYKASLDYGEGYVDDEDVSDALALETALEDAQAEAAKRDREMAYFVLLLRDWTIPKLLEDYDPEVVASAKKRVDAVWAETHATQGAQDV